MTTNTDQTVGSNHKAPAPPSMRVRVVDRGTGPSYQGVKIRHYTIAATCPQCGGPRGETYGHNFCEDGEWLNCDRWDNPCGHVDYYHAVIAEALSNEWAAENRSSGPRVNG